MGAKLVRYRIKCPYCNTTYISRFDRIPTSCGLCKRKFMGKLPKTKRLWV